MNFFKLKLQNDNEEVYYMDTLNRLSVEDRKTLVDEVKSWSTVEFVGGKKILSDLTGFNIPEQLIRDLYETNLDLAFESYSHSLDDSFGRHMLLCAFGKKMCDCEWPDTSNGKLTSEMFLIEVKEGFKEYMKSQGLNFEISVPSERFKM